MIEGLVAFSVRQRRGVLATWAVLAVAAAIVSSRLKLDALPDLTNNQVQVLVRAPGLTPDEVELQITRPLETALGGLPGLAQHRSLSRAGLSALTAIFEDDVDPYRARQLVQERLAVAAGSLPAAAEPPELGPLTGGLGEVFHVFLRSPERTPAQLLELTTLRVVPLLRALPGVVEVNTWGGARRTLDVVADPARLAQAGVTLAELRDALQRATGSAPGAALPAGAGQVLLRAVARPQREAELGAAIVAHREGGALVRVSDVASIREGQLPRLGAATIDGKGEGVYAMAQMLRGENAREVTRRIRAQMEVVRAALPADVRIEPVYDRASLVDATLHTVGRNLLEGGLLVVVVLLLTLGSLRAGLLVAAAIPLSMLGATAAMVFLDVPGNLLSLGAVDFGLLVDGAVVMVEHVFHRLHGRPAVEAGLTHQQRIERISREVGRPVFFSVLVILLVYVPVLALTGVDGKMFRPMALTVVFALVTALVVSLTFVPAAASFLLTPASVPAQEPWLVRALLGVHLRLLEVTRRRPFQVLAGAAAIFVLAAVVLVRSGSELAPQLDEGDLVVQTTRAADLSIESAAAASSRMEAALLAAAPEVKQVVSRIGSPAVATDVMGLEQADVFVALAPRARWRPGLTREALIGQLEKAIEQATPGSEPGFTQPIQMRFNELLGGATTDVVASVFGEDLPGLWRAAQALAEVSKGVPGVEDVRVLAPPDVPLLEVRPRPDEAALAGLSSMDVLDGVQALRAGLPVGATWQGPQRVPLVLKLQGAASAFELASTVLPAPGGALVPLSRVAEVAALRAPSLVAHENGQRKLGVGFNVRGRTLGEVVAEVRAKSAALPREANIRVEWGGQIESLEAATRRLLLVVPAVLVLILLVLYATFRRLRPSLIIFTHVPFACVGGVLALAARQMPLSISAAIGLIALSGVAVMNGVVLLTQVLRNEEAGLDPGAAALAAARTRARPVLMTALVAALGFVPMALATGVGAEVQRPLATVVVGGLITSTILTLLILPTLYPWMAARKRSRAETSQVALA